jgi:hypothetical protein
MCSLLRKVLREVITGNFSKTKNILLCTRLYKYAPNLESLLTQQYVCVMCTLWSDNTCVFTRFHSVKNANTQRIWSSVYSHQIKLFQYIRFQFLTDNLLSINYMIWIQKPWAFLICHDFTKTRSKIKFINCFIFFHFHLKFCKSDYITLYFNLVYLCKILPNIKQQKKRMKLSSFRMPDDTYSHCVLNFMTKYGPLKIDTNHMSISHHYILEVKMRHWC